MWLILQHDRPDDWVVGTGEEHSVREFCELAFSHAGIELEWRGEGTEEIGVDTATGAKRVVVNPRYFRPAEVDRLLADSSKARRELGWQPRVGFDELVRVMVDADRRAVSTS
jgi:GDPmannose 4,6-dehydratase